MNTCTPTWDNILSYFKRTHLDHRGMTSWEEMSERLWELIVQVLPFSCTPCHSHPFGFPAVFPAGFLGLIAVLEESYQSSCDFTVQFLPVSIKPLRKTMTAHYWIQLRKSFIKPIYSYLHTAREIQRHTKKHKQNHSPLPPSLPHTHLPFHPKETVHIQTNRGDGYCPNAIILYCPSP